MLPVAIHGYRLLPRGEKKKLRILNIKPELMERIQGLELTMVNTGILENKGSS
jgi:hypothetical protein